MNSTKSEASGGIPKEEIEAEFMKATESYRKQLKEQGLQRNLAVENMLYNYFYAGVRFAEKRLK